MQPEKQTQPTDEKLEVSSQTVVNDDENEITPEQKSSDRSFNMPSLNINRGRSKKSSSKSDKPSRRQSQEPMEETTDDNKRSLNPVTLLIGLIVLLVIGGGLVYALFSNFSNQPVDQSRFRKALENHMSTNYINQTLKVEANYTTSQMSGLIEARTDFSNPAQPSSAISYQLAIDSQSGQSGETISDIVVDSSGEYVYLKQLPSQSGLPESAKDKWVFVGQSESEALTLVDPLKAGDKINTPLGELLVGKFSAELRQEVLSRIDGQGVYTINSSSQEDIDGTATDRFDITIDNEKLSTINTYVADQLGLDAEKAAASAGSGSEEVTVWVDHANNNFVRMEFNKADSTGSQSNSITYEYPAERPDIKRPAEFITIKEFTEILESSQQERFNAVNASAADTALRTLLASLITDIQNFQAHNNGRSPADTAELEDAISDYTSDYLGDYTFTTKAPGENQVQYAVGYSCASDGNLQEADSLRTVAVRTLAGDQSFLCDQS